MGGPRPAMWGVPGGDYNVTLAADDRPNRGGGSGPRIGLVPGSVSPAGACKDRAF